MAAIYFFVLGISFSGNSPSSYLESTVRPAIVRVIDRSESRGGVGTGTIVGRNEAGPLILTAFHVVDPGLHLQVEFFKGDGSTLLCDRVEVLAIARDADLALIHAISDYQPPRMLSVPDDQDTPSGGVSFVSVGCNRGETPSWRAERMTGKTLLRRPSGRALFLLTDGEAIKGRSGGPLVDGKGNLIGVCRGGLAATALLPAEGLYASALEIHALLEKTTVGRYVLGRPELPVTAAVVTTPPEYLGETKEANGLTAARDGLSDAQ